MIDKGEVVTFLFRQPGKNGLSRRPFQYEIASPARGTFRRSQNRRHALCVLRLSRCIKYTVFSLVVLGGSSVSTTARQGVASTAVHTGSLPLGRKFILAPTQFGTSYLIRGSLRSYSIDYFRLADQRELSPGDSNQNAELTTSSPGIARSLDRRRRDA